MTVPHTATRSDVDDPEDTEKKSAQQERDIEDIRGNLGDLLLELVPKASHVGAARFDTGPPHDCSRTWYRCHCRCRGRHWVALPKRRAADDASRPPLASGICAAAHDACTCSLHNRLKYLTPNAELTVLNVSSAEAAEYDVPPPIMASASRYLSALIAIATFPASI